MAELSPHPRYFKDTLGLVMGKAEGAAQSLGEWDAIKTPQEE